MKRTHLLWFVATILVALPGIAGAGTIDPASFTATIDVGDSVTVNKTVTLDPGGATKVDFFFLADNTGSMGGVLANVKSVAGSLLTSLDTTYADAAFGVGRYLGDPNEPGFGDPYSYQLQQSVNTSTALANAAIVAWGASGGGDIAEANFFALREVATEGVATGQVTGWRLGSQKVVLWFGDAPSHTVTVTEAQAIAALFDNDVIVIALNSGPNGGAMDTGNQADNVALGTGGAAFHNFAAVPVANIVSTIVALIGTVSSTVDLTFGHTAPPGVGVAFTLDDPLGYDDVPGGASRTFSVTFTGVTPGDYSFTVFVTGVAAEKDRIIVGDVVIPEPSTLALLGLGALGLGFGAYRRRNQK